MAILNVEFKAKTGISADLEKKLLTRGAQFIGIDQQVDTYFNVSTGRLKLREGNIENALIWYQRQNIAGAKQSDVLLYQHQPDKTLKEILTRSIGIKVIVEKKRKIYFIDNVKFHFDQVDGLGTFVEVEAIDRTGQIGITKLQKQCEEYAALFSILPSDYIAVSYSDMIMEATNESN